MGSRLEYASSLPARWCGGSDSWKSRYVVEGNVTLRHGSGRPRQTTKRSDRFLVRLAKKHHLSSAQALLQQWEQRVSRWIVRRRLLEKQLRSYRPALCPKLTRHHMGRRLQWCMAKLAWRLPAWKRVVFADESKFCLLSTDIRKRVWRKRGEDRYQKTLVQEKVAFGGDSVLVWGAI